MCNKLGNKNIKTKSSCCLQADRHQRWFGQLVAAVKRSFFLDRPDVGSFECLQDRDICRLQLDEWQCLDSSGAAVEAPVTVGTEVETEVGAGLGDLAQDLLSACVLGARVGQLCEVHWPAGEADSAASSDWSPVRLFRAKARVTQLVTMATSYAELSPDARLELAERHKTRGNDFFRAGQHGAAMLNYNRALAYCLLPGNLASASSSSPSDWSADPRLRRLARLIRQNMAGVQLSIKPNNPELVLANCNAALQPGDGDADDDGVEMLAKRLYRRGCARLALGQLDEARQDLARAASLAPSDRAVSARLAEVESKLKTSDAQLASSLRSMFLPAKR